MSARAYIIKDVETRRKEELEPLFNLQNKYVLSIFEKYGNVFSNQNFDIGFVEIISEMWDEYKEDIKVGDFEKPTKEEDIAILQKIDSYLKEHEYLFCTVYY